MANRSSKSVIQMEERAQRALDLRRQGLSYSQIAATMNSSKSIVHRDVGRLLKRLAKQNDGLTAEFRALELERLDDLERAARRVLTDKHVNISHGRVVYDTEIDSITGEVKKVKMMDDAPILQAIHALIRIGERRARLLGIDMPTRTELGGPDGGPIVAVTTDDLAARFEQLVREQAARLKGTNGGSK
jgi:hypothetical protein